MPGNTPSSWLDPLKFGTSTGGAAGSAEDTNTLGLDRLDVRIPPDQYRVGGLQVTRMKGLLQTMSQFLKGGTRLQVLKQSSNPFAPGEIGFWSDTSNSPKFTAENGSVSTLGGVSAPLTLTLDDATTNAVSVVETLVHTTSGTAANNIGTGLAFQAENAAGSTVDAVRIDGILTNATGGSEASAIAFSTRTGGGSLTERCRLDNTGQLFFGGATNAGVGFAGSQLNLVGGGSSLRWDGVSYFPISDGTINAGGSANRWNSGYYKRLRTSGTATSTGDYTLSGGWGNTASVGSLESASDDTHGAFTVTSAGTGQAAGPTITLTYKDGTWTNAPKCIVVLEDSSDAGTSALQFIVKASSTATVLTITFKGLPVATKTYSFRYMVLGAN